MADSIMQRIPVVAGLGYIERVRRLPSSLTVTLVTEPDNRYFRHAIAVMESGEKVGYVAPEIAARYFEPLQNHTGEPVTCPARRARHSDHETSGVELLLDFSALAVAARE
jgi:hypothetical protein